MINLKDYLLENKLNIGDSVISPIGISIMVQTEDMIQTFSSKPGSYKIVPKIEIIKHLKSPIREIR